MILIAGPCLAESKDLLFQCADCLKEITSKYRIKDFYFKSSYRKANRTSFDSYEGPGDELALSWLSEIKFKYSFNILTDVHAAEEVQKASEVADVIQIPAFLSRQTSLIKAAANSGKIVNIKKAQFMAPEDSIKAADKSHAFGAKETWITERGTSFGYHDLVVDMRGIQDIKESNYKIIFDATHSLQKPSLGTESGGERKYIHTLAKSAIAAGADGIFFETHPNPDHAKSDKATQLPLNEAENFIKNAIEIYQFINKGDNL